MVSSGANKRKRSALLKDTSGYIRTSDDETIQLHVDKIKASGEFFDIAEEHPSFWTKLESYLDILDIRGVKKENYEDLLFALLETHTIISIDEDMDGLGLEKVIDLWQTALKE